MYKISLENLDTPNSKELTKESCKEDSEANLKRPPLAKYRTIWASIKISEWTEWGLKSLHLQKGSNTSLVKCGSSCQFVGNTEERRKWQGEKSRLWEAADQMPQVLQQILCEEKKGMEGEIADLKKFEFLKAGKTKVQCLGMHTFW